MNDLSLALIELSNEIDRYIGIQYRVDRAHDDTVDTDDYTWIDDYIWAIRGMAYDLDDKLK